MEASHTQNGQIPLMLIHGAWLSARSWENYVDYFAKRGFAVSAPEWPRKQGDVEEIRETAEASAGLGVKEIVDHYEELIGEFDHPPVLIGHSYGGLFVELLLDRGLGRAGVAMSPAPPKGILALPFSTLKAGAPALAHPSKWHGVVTLTPEEFTYAFVNTFSGAGRGGRLRALRGPGDRADLLRGGVRQLPSAPADRGALQERGARAAADRRSYGGPHGAGIAGEGPVQALRALAGARPTTSSSRVGRTCTWSPPIGRRSRPVLTAGWTASSTLRSATSQQAS